MRSDPSHLSEKLIIFTMGFRLWVVCVCECWGEECGTGKQIGPKIEVVLGDVCVCVWRGEGSWDQFSRTLWSTLSGAQQPWLTAIKTSLTALTPMFQHPWVPGQPQVSSLSNVSLDHLIGLQLWHHISLNNSGLLLVSVMFYLVSDISTEPGHGQILIGLKNWCLSNHIWAGFGCMIGERTRQNALTECNLWTHLLTSDVD